MVKNIRIIDTMYIDPTRMKQIGVGKRHVIKRLRPVDERFSVGGIFWLSDGLYKLEELTKQMRCKKRRHMIFRPLDVGSLDNNTNYTVYKLKGATV